jgi:hypothetical protein
MCEEWAILRMCRDCSRARCEGTNETGRDDGLLNGGTRLGSVRELGSKVIDEGLCGRRSTAKDSLASFAGPLGALEMVAGSLLDEGEHGALKCIRSRGACVGTSRD